MKKVLLIDDDAGFRTVLAALLSAHGWRVIQAEDGEEGLRLAFQEKPSIVICDLLMPRCNGFQFCRALKSQSGAAAHTKIIVTTGSGYEIDRVNALESGADEFLTKPPQEGELLALLKKLSVDSEQSPPQKQGGNSTDQGGSTRVKFWGVRGSIPSPGPETAFYGGNTSCVEVRSDGELIILDAGTGIRGLGRELKREFGNKPISATILISHTHWDHIQGFPFFAPAYDPANRLRICGYEGPRKGIEATLAIQMESPYFPISLQSMPGNIDFEELKALDFPIGPVRVKAMFVNHPGVCVAYRLNTRYGSVVYFPDNELHGRLRSSNLRQDSAEGAAFAKSQDDKLRGFIEDADVVIADAQYDALEYPSHARWGHSCVDDVIDLAMEARVKHLFLFHHDPDHSDAHITAMVEGARQRALRNKSSLQVDAAREGHEVVLRKG